MLTVLTPLGGTVLTPKGSLLLKPIAIRGEDSAGMLCGRGELGLLPAHRDHHQRVLEPQGVACGHGPHTGTGRENASSYR